MANIDFYGYERDQAGTYLYSSDVAAIYFDNNGTASGASRAGLVQNVAASYQQAVLPRFEAGSSELYWVTGQSKGDVSVGRLVSYGGLLNGIQPGRGVLQNGILGGIHVKIGQMADSNSVNVSLPQSQLMLAGCVLAGYSVSFTTGALEVSEQLGIQVAFLQKIVGGGDVGYSPNGGGLGGAAGGIQSALSKVIQVAGGVQEAAAGIGNTVVGFQRIASVF